jgi:hypothetical protein
MTNEAIALSILFLEKVKGFPKDGQGKIKAAGHYKFTVMKDIQDLLAGSISYKELDEAMNHYIRLNMKGLKETYVPSEILQKLNIPFKKGVQQVIPDNLINQGHFYYHQELQLTPPPPVITQLPTGEFHSTYEEFYLEIKEVFTLDDLVRYFHAKVGVHDNGTFEKDKGAFRHMLKSYEADFILHLIDEAYVQAIDRGGSLPKEPFAIQDYLEDARQVYENRKNICFEGGFDRVIPRNRH